VAKKYNLSRAEQDSFAFESQAKAKAAMDEGHFDEEIVPVSVAGIDFTKPHFGLKLFGYVNFRPLILGKYISRYPKLHL
jgi:hypothetical protein